ncbi:MAG: membrane-bound lytic murein transglycosylase MltF [Desulfovermiculus sp.]
MIPVRNMPLCSAFSFFVTSICIAGFLVLPASLQAEPLHAQWYPTRLARISSLQKIKALGRITLITQNNANAYYMYRGDKMGFEYDLAQAFAEHLGVSLHVVTPGWSQMIPALKKRKGDFIAAGLTITENRQEHVAFSLPYMDVQQMVIVHKDQSAIQRTEDLSGLTIHVREHTSYEQRLQELRDQGLDVHIVLHRDVPTEDLIRQVAAKDIPATVADSNIAQLNRRYFPEIRMAFPISERQSLGWAVRKQDQALLQAINEFLASAQDYGSFAQIYHNYYANAAIFDYVDLKKFHERIKTRLPDFAGMIKKEAKAFGFDWRLIAAVVYQESHFDPQASSYTGVKGLMQVTLNTAREMDIANRLEPAQSIHAGVKYLSLLYDRFKDINDHTQRIRFALASYNIGYGHVRDAQRLAQNEGLDPNKWSSMTKILPLLSQPRYYSQTRYGYARGTEPVRYVKRIFSYYEILRQKADTSPSTVQESSSKTS